MWCFHAKKTDEQQADKALLREFRRQTVESQWEEISAIIESGVNTVVYPSIDKYRIQKIDKI